MGMTVRKRKDDFTQKVFVHKVADIRGGVSVKTSELNGNYLPEGAVLSAPDNGICHVLKTAKVAIAAAETDTDIKVTKNSGFKAGDFVMLDEEATAVAITAVDTASSKLYDVLTIDTALGEIEAGVFVVQAAEASTGNSTLAYTPLALAGTGKPYATDSNLNEDAWVIGVTKGYALPKCISKYLTGIINY